MTNEVPAAVPTFICLTGNETAEPMWKIVPTRDENGRLLSDFMMLIPKLREQPLDFIQHTLNCIAGIIRAHAEVRFVNLNVPLNLLWISHRSLPGVGLELVARIQNRIPQALLIAQKLTPRT